MIDLIILPYLTPTTVLGFISSLLLFYFLILPSWSTTKSKSPPQAGRAWPLIGHLHLFATEELRHRVLSNLADKYGPIFIVRMGMYPNLVINNRELVKEVFTTHDLAVCCRPKMTGSKIMGHNFANFGFSPYGEYWRLLRKITATELLSNRRLELLKHIRGSEVEGSIKDLYKAWSDKKKDHHAQQGLVELTQWFNDLNFNVVIRMVAGKRYFGSAGGVEDEREVRRCQKAMRDFFELMGKFVVRDAIPFLGWMDLGGHEKEMKRTAKELDCIVGEWLQEHKRKRNSKEVKGSNYKEEDFMDVLLNAIDGVDLAGYDVDTVCKATATTLITGGTDTTTVIATWGLTLLLNNPAALRKVQEELDTHVGKERLLNESDIDKLVYLQATVKEILRLYPPGPLAGPREFSESCTIGGYHIPAGTRLLVNLYKVHRDPNVWSDPNEFKPERFLGTHKSVDVRGQDFELIPFGAGRRSCPGISFGLHMTHLVLASLLQAFEVSKPSDEPIDMSEIAGLTNCKATPLEVLVKPRLPSSVYASRY